MEVFWTGFSSHAMVEQRGLPDFFLTLSANDGWPQVQATLREGWGAVVVRGVLYRIRVDSRS